MTARVVHFEVPFDDADRARSFYQDVFDWQIQFIPEMDYNIVSTGPATDQGMPSEPGYIGGGMLPRQAPVTTPYGLARSDDDGASWTWREFDSFPGSKSGIAYCRCVRAPWNDGTVIVCVGDYIPGATGALEVSRDGGDTWKRVDLPTPPNSTMYWLAVHDDLPGVVVATSVFGQIYVSEDHAHTWRKLDREFGEIRAVCISPD